ncbi:hypothetical protein FPSE_02685 [Fusarium pseudograminearum CS3096]|uniref:Uncharacterized protein n=1 Tax=Fusarium pseudograminearum (strain CS3096) TaxID=1028729 RepID=K3UWJ5_FUSPC|nr:hypothetical protein FPSE_02685 [Fusarium pseudograminearum CS3096]EKJ77041.1 hypothetical protein FPSE_02685 [Fusarium pseudograminearum CS3096]
MYLRDLNGQDTACLVWTTTK